MIIWITCTKDTCGRVLIDTLSRYAQKILDQHYQYSVDIPLGPQLTLDRHVGQQSVRSRLILD